MRMQDRLVVRDESAGMTMARLLWPSRKTSNMSQPLPQTRHHLRQHLTTPRPARDADASSPPDHPVPLRRATTNHSTSTPFHPAHPCHPDPRPRHPQSRNQPAPSAPTTATPGPKARPPPSSSASRNSASAAGRRCRSVRSWGSNGTTKAGAGQQST